MTPPSTPPLPLIELTEARPLGEALAADVRRGLTGPRKSLPPIYLYDTRGSELFERITELEEYYPTRAESEILERDADDLVGAIGPDELVELGSGSSRKTDLLLAAMRRRGGGRYAALEISETALTAALQRLNREHPWLAADGYLGDFHHDLDRIPRTGRRLVAFLGSTLGNLIPSERETLLAAIARNLTVDDGFLLGVDLVKHPDVLIPAYDDAEGVTAAFNRNVLTVVNRELDGDLPVASFAHRAVWNPAAERIEMHLVASAPVHAHLARIGLDVVMDRHEHIVTEYSHKFRIEHLRRELSGIGLQVSQVVTDHLDRFAVILARPDRDAARKRPRSSRVAPGTQDLPAPE
ncbi:MAG: L-histidine N(alpha)-methyltransferase [Nitriliruptoraceae bacterium]